MKNEIKPAFPYCGMDTSSGSATDGDHFVQEKGLSKREYFAAMAMQGLLSHPSFSHGPEDIAIAAVNHADALLKQLETMNELIDAVLAWWEEHKYDVLQSSEDQDECNIYDEEPEFVKIAKRLKEEQ